MNKNSQSKIISIFIILLVLVGIFSLYFVLAQETPSKDSFLPTLNKYGKVKYGTNFIDYPQADGNIMRYETKSIQNVFEDGGWKDKKDARSLINKTGFSINFGKIDKNFNVRTEDFNYTSVRICLSSNITNQNIPFKVWHYESFFNETLEEYFSEKVYDVNINIFILSKIEERCFNINFEDSLFNKYFEFGEGI